MAFPAPHALSPSKVSSFTDCALAFRFSAIDRLPEPPAPWSTKGTLVHTALERLHLLPAPERTLEAGLDALAGAADDLRRDPDYTELQLDAEAEAAFHDDAASLVRRYFQLEDPRRIEAIGLEVSLDVDVEGVRLRGIIDRLELDADGELVVTDYKTGSVPSVHHERKRLSGVHLYSLLCEQLLGRRPRRVQLLYLRQPVAIVTEPTDQSTRGTRRSLAAVWQAVERACAREDFRPQPSRLCDYCAFRAYCPAFGGDPDAASQATPGNVGADGAGDTAPVDEPSRAPVYGALAPV
jgi:putative RecB family exonuclease